jgi:hypothetical protein
MPSTEMDDTEELDLLPTSDQDEAGASKEAETPANAASSTAEDVSKPADGEKEVETADIVRDVVKARSQPPAVASSAEGEEAGSAPVDAKTPKRDDENFSDVPFNKHPRFQEVLGKLKTAEVDAGRYRNVQSFLDQNGLDAAEVADGLQVMALMKHNPVEAWKRMQPTVQNLLIAAGEVLPPDLQQRVLSGEMSHETALMLSRTQAETQALRAGTSFAEQQAQRRREAEERSQAETAAYERQMTAQTWEDDRRARDPNFDAKMPLVIEEVKTLQRDGWQPKTSEGVKKQLDQAYRVVSAKFRPAVTAPVAKAPLRAVTGGQVSGTAQVATPQSTEDHVKRVLAKRTVRAAG